MKATSFAVTKHTKASPINGSVSGLSRQSANATDDAMASLIVQDGVPGNRPTIPIPTSQPVLDQLLSSNTDILSYEMDHIRGGFSNLLASDVIHGPRLSVEGFSEYGNLWESILSPKLMKD